MKDVIARTLGSRCKAARSSISATQADIAEQLGVSTEFYARMERGVALPSLVTFVRLTAILKVQPNHLLDEHAQVQMVEQATNHPPELRQLIFVLREAPLGQIRMLIRIVRGWKRK